MLNQKPLRTCGWKPDPAFAAGNCVGCSRRTVCCVAGGDLADGEVHRLQLGAADPNQLQLHPADTSAPLRVVELDFRPLAILLEHLERGADGGDT